MALLPEIVSKHLSKHSVNSEPTTSCFMKKTCKWLLVLLTFLLLKNVSLGQAPTQQQLRLDIYTWNLLVRPGIAYIPPTKYPRPLLEFYYYNQLNTQP